MIAPHRGNRSKPPTQDRRRLSRYMRRWLVERFFAWIQWQRRILIRWEYHAHNLDSIFSSMRSMRRALGFMGAGPLARSVCPVASNPVGDLVHAGFELLWLLRLKARAHYAQAIADTGGSRSRASFSRRVMNVRSAASVGLGRGVRVGA